MRAALLALGLVIAVLVIAAFLFSRTETFRSFALREGRERLREQGIELSATSMDVDLTRVAVSLRGVSLRSIAAPELPPFLLADRASVDVGLLSTVRRVLTLDEALVEGLHLHVVITEDGRTNLPRSEQAADPAEEPFEIPDFLVDRARIQDGSLLVEDRARSARLEVPSFRLDLDGNPFTLDHELDLAGEEEGALSLEDRSLPIRRFALDGRLSPERLLLHELELELGESRLSAEATIRDFATPELDLEVRPQLHVGELAELVRPAEEVSGRLEGLLSVSGRTDALVVSADLRGRELAYERWPPADVAVSAAFRAAEEALEVRALSLSSPAGELVGSGVVALAPGAGESSFQAELQRVDLRALTEAAGMETRIASLATGHLEARWPEADVRRAEGRFGIELDRTRPTPAKSVVPVAGGLEAVAAGGRIDVRISTLEAFGTRVEGEVVVRAPGPENDYMRGALGGRLEVRARLQEVAESTARFRGAVEEEPSAGADLDGNAVLSLGLGGSVPAPQVRFDLAADGVRLGELTDLRAKAEGEASTSALVLDELELRTRELLLVSARGEVGLEGSDPPLNLNVSAREVPIAPLLSPWTGSSPADGDVFLEATVRGTRNLPRGDVHLRIENLHSHGETFGRLSVEGALEGRAPAELELRLEKPREEGGIGSLVANASFLPETGAYELRLQSEGLRLDRLEVPEAGILRGDLELTASGSGTLDEPGLELRAASPDLELDGREVGPLRLSSTVASSRARVDLDWERVAVSGSTEIALEAPHELSFEISARDTDLSRLPLVTGQELAGRVTANASGSGSLDDPKAATVELLATDVEVRLRDQIVQSQGPVQVHYRDRALRIDSLSLASGSSTLELEGLVPIEAGAGRGEVLIEGDLLLSDLARFAPPENELSLDGRLRVEGSIAGTLQAIEPRISVAMEGGSFDNPAVSEPVTGIGFTVSMEGGVVRWEGMTAEMGPARFQSEGEVPLSIFSGELPLGIQSPSAPMELSLEVRNFELALLEDVPETLQGVVSLELEARSPAAELDQVEASLTFPELSIEASGYRIEQATTTALSIREGVLVVDELLLAGEATRLEVSGSAGLSGSRPLDVRASGETELAAFAPAFPDVQMGGTGRFEVTVGGTAEDPEVTGFLNLAGAALALEEPEIAATDVDAHLRFEDGRLSMEELEGELNGGRLSVSGGARLEAGELTEVDVALRSEEVHLEYPLELQTISNADLRLLSHDGGIVLGGEVAIERGSYTDRLEIEDEVLERLRRGGDPEIPEERQPILAQLRYDLGIRTIDPIVMDNNQAETAITFDLRLSGDYYRPGLTGRLDLEEGGEIYLREHTYVLERGTITFLSETSIEPALDILARTEAADFDITLQVTGIAGDLETTLTSDPPLPEVDILAVLATGRTVEEFRGEEVHVAQEQLLSYLAGRTAAKLGSGLERNLGLSEVRIEPHLVSAESDPNARLTIGQEIAPDLRLVYSQNLTNSSDQIYIAEYEATRRFTTMATQQEDNSYRFDIRHRLSFGGGPSSGRPSEKRRAGEDVRIGQVVFTGNEALSQEAVADAFGTKSGDHYDFFEIRNSVKDVEEAYREEDFLEVRTRLQRIEGESGVDLKLEIQEGPRVRFAFAGHPVPGAVEAEVREAWSRGFFDRQRATEAEEAVQGWLMKDGYLEARVESAIERPSVEETVVMLTIEPGTRYDPVELAVETGGAIDDARIEEVLELLDAEETVHTDPRRITKRLGDLFAAEGYLDAEIEEPRYELDPEKHSARVVIDVREGEAFLVGQVVFSGNRVVSDEELRRAIPLHDGLRYRIEDRRSSIGAIENAYRDQGYNDVVVTPGTRRRQDDAVVDVAFDIEEGRQEVIRDVVVAGTEETTDRFVRSQLEVGSGDVLDLDLLTESRKNLYKTGAFATVEMKRVEGEADDGEKPVTLEVHVDEVKPFSLRYGASWDTEKGPGAIVDFVNQNSLGRARTLGVRGRYDGWLREARLYFSQPQVRDFPVKSNATLFYAREFLTRDPGMELLSTGYGFSFDQELQLRNLYVFSVGYRYEWNEVAALVADSDLAGITPLHVTAPLTTTLTRDSRDEILDATRGSFQSQALELAPTFLGSDMGYVRYFGQYNAYVPFSEPSEIPWARISKSRWVYAGSVRLGLAGGLGSADVPVSRRFFAGGGTSVRGFEHNSLGPPTGGNALFITNHEIRFPLVSFFDGVGFLDVGNVYESVGAMDLLDLRETVGIGLRMRTPYFLIRLDYGFKLDRKPGESASGLFFSIGQAF